VTRTSLPPAPPGRRAGGLRAGPGLALAALLALGAPSARGEEPAAPWTKDVEALSEGVKEIAAPGTPGTVVVWGREAFPVLLGKRGHLEHQPVVAAAGWGKGRVVAFGHTGFGSAESLAVGETRRCLENAIAWAGREPLEKVRLGVWGRSLEDATKVVRVVEGSLAGDLPKIDVLMAFGAELGPADAKRLGAWVRSGGGLLVAQTGWGWQQLAKEADLRKNAWNQLMGPAGLAFSEATVERTGARGFVVAGVPGPEFHAAEAVRLLQQAAGGKAGPATRQASANAMAAWPLLPREGKGLRAEILALVARHAGALLPAPTVPLRPDRPLERFLLAVEAHELEAGPSGVAQAHRAAVHFPGAVVQGVKDVARTVEIDLARPGWHSTGLYARPGVAVEASVELVPTTSNQATPPPPTPGPGIELQIGCHSDRLWHLDAWPRVPDIVRRAPFEAGLCTLASAFGGLVYVCVEQPRPGRARVALKRAIEAPHYVRGQGTPESWRAMLRSGAPWGELATDKVILTLPIWALRRVRDPEPLLAFWDQVLDGAADLAARPRTRERPERYVADVEISAGYMHSGYPIMTHLDAAERLVDLELLRTKGDWGLFHELGHNHQEPEWTFEGTVEVTCNLFSLYLQDRLTKTPGLEAHEALAEREKRTRAHLAKGAPFAAWQQDPFLALEMYVQLQEAFGWEPFTAVFAEYRQLDDLLRPKAEDKKRDQWMVRFGKRVGRDLGPFFQAWGVPVSESAREALKGLPAWMPAGFPPS
jgi:hypothetical protein